MLLSQNLVNPLHMTELSDGPATWSRMDEGYNHKVWQRRTIVKEQTPTIKKRNCVISQQISDCNSSLNGVYDIIVCGSFSLHYLTLFTLQ